MVGHSYKAAGNRALRANIGIYSDLPFDKVRGAEFLMWCAFRQEHLGSLSDTETVKVEPTSVAVGTTIADRPPHRSVRAR